MSTPDNHDSQSHVTPGADLWSRRLLRPLRRPPLRPRPPGTGLGARCAGKAGVRLHQGAAGGPALALFSRLLWSVVVLLVLWAVFFKDTATKTSTSPHTAVVEIKGEIASGADASAEFVVAAMRSAFEDSGSRAVVLLINSPGGSPVQAGIINDEMTRLKAKYNKPLYAVVEESCASAAYYIAAAADEIFVDKASIVGSIGVLMDGFGFTGVMDKVGVERRLLTAGENKGFLDPFSPMSSQQRNLRCRCWSRFTSSSLAWSRPVAVTACMRAPKCSADCSGPVSRPWSLGLADKLGSLDYVAREVVKAEEVIDYTRRDNVAERLAKRFGAAIGEGSVKAMRGLMPSIR